VRDLRAAGVEAILNPEWESKAVVTGVPNPESDYGHYESSPDKTNSPDEIPTLRVEKYPDAPPYVSSEAESTYRAPDQAETYLSVVTRLPTSPDDPGVIAYGWFSVKGGDLIVLDGKRRKIATCRLKEGDDARELARQHLQAKAGNGFNRPLTYPNLSVA
jgi:hypothetical protein